MPTLRKKTPSANLRDYGQLGPVVEALDRAARDVAQAEAAETDAIVAHRQPSRACRSTGRWRRLATCQPAPSPRRKLT